MCVACVCVREREKNTWSERETAQDTHFAIKMTLEFKIVTIRGCCHIVEAVQQKLNMMQVYTSKVKEETKPCHSPTQLPPNTILTMEVRHPLPNLSFSSLPYIYTQNSFRYATQHYIHFETSDLLAKLVLSAQVKTLIGDTHSV